MDNLGFYLFCLIAIIVAIAIIKKVVGCMFRSVVFVILLIAIAAAYYYFGRWFSFEYL